jgi:ABC-type sugar transport system permease subunit
VVLSTVILHLISLIRSFSLDNRSGIQRMIRRISLLPIRFFPATVSSILYKYSFRQDIAPAGRNMVCERGRS